jgi:hypothetical protein
LIFPVFYETHFSTSFTKKQGGLSSPRFPLDVVWGKFRLTDSQGIKVIILETDRADTGRPGIQQIVDRIPHQDTGTTVNRLADTFLNGLAVQFKVLYHDALCRGQTIGENRMHTTIGTFFRFQMNLDTIGKLDVATVMSPTMRVIPHTF